MSQIKNFDKQNLKALRISIEAALANVAQEYGLQSISIGNIRFDANMFSSKLTATTKNENIGNSVKGIMPGIGETRRSGSQIFEVTKIELGRPKYPIVVKNQRGTPYKLSIEQWDNMLPYQKLF